jgi:hypothetical protein
MPRHEAALAGLSLKRRIQNYRDHRFSPRQCGSCIEVSSLPTIIQYVGQRSKGISLNPANMAICRQVQMLEKQSSRRMLHAHGLAQQFRIV